ncbi:hypothetical protein ABI_08900 [Asticcacaulis biprosthecium C19]|uniref:Uncharacterized protein n=1 Tax=Asticcacaulis biprosthecium C19 TaxID=715226 RepID=F4QGC6_9CAUL|nr:hypothetical protein [Asticcacaulis biprosthecium]EGF92454.1 hypothetical protein ABI_08900 [Asticcacaulis biprosthecium C19]
MTDVIIFRKRVNQALKIDMSIEVEPTGALHALELDAPCLGQAGPIGEAARDEVAKGLDRILMSLRTFMIAGYLVRDVVDNFNADQRPFVQAIADAQDYVLARDTTLMACLNAGKAA